MASTKGTSKTSRSRGGTFGARLREARERAGLTIPTAAKRMGVARSTFYSWESDERAPRNLVRLVGVVGTTVAELFGEAP